MSSLTHGERRFPTRPDDLPGVTERRETPAGNVYVTVNYHGGQPVEVFVRLGKSGETERAMTEAIGRLCSAALQYGTPLRVLGRQLRGISQHDTLGFGPNKILSVPDAVAQILERLVED